MSKDTDKEAELARVSELVEERDRKVDPIAVAYGWKPVGQVWTGDSPTEAVLLEKIAALEQRLGNVLTGVDEISDMADPVIADKDFGYDTPADQLYGITSMAAMILKEGRPRALGCGRVIQSAEEHAEALEKIKVLMCWDPKPGTLRGDRLELLVTLVEAYERKHFHIP